MARTSLLDIAIANSTDAQKELVIEVARNFPEVTGTCRWTGNSVPGVGGAGTIRGLLYKTKVLVDFPAAAFRDANEGVDETVAQYEARVTEAFLFNPRGSVDAQVADADERGAEVLIAEDMQVRLLGAFRQLSRQFYYGTNATYGGHAKGNPGLLDAVPAANVVDAGGTTGDTGSSVWLVKWGPTNVEWVVGNNGRFAMEEPRLGDARDTDGNLFTAWITEMRANVGLQMVNPVAAVARIKKITQDASKTLTDAMISDALSRLSEPADAIFMSRRSWFQLQASRTATSPTGAEAPLPKEVHGVPIMVSDALSNTESLTAI